MGLELYSAGGNYITDCWLPVLDRLQTATELDSETVQALPL